MEDVVCEKGIERGRGKWPETWVTFPLPPRLAAGGYINMSQTLGNKDDMQPPNPPP